MKMDMNSTAAVRNIL